jgi:hypothetical protein
MVERSGPWRRLERVAVLLVVLHSVFVGVLLLFFTRWTMDFAGWGTVAEPFFPRQSGAFHLVVATGYWLEYRRSGGITLLLMAKATAVVFLVALNPWSAAWSIPFSGVLDGLMLVGMFVLHRLAGREAAA